MLCLFLQPLSPCSKNVTLEYTLTFSTNAPQASTQASTLCQSVLQEGETKMKPEEMYWMEDSGAIKEGKAL